MPDPTPTAPPQRATLLIGYGGFGLDLLRRFLASTAVRGVLVWEEPAGGAGHERRLRDLSLLWVPDPFTTDETGPDPESALEGDTIEVMRDLYRQIQTVVAAADPQTALAEAMQDAARGLLDAAARAARTGNLPLGLDVIVLAHPHNRAAVGHLNRLLAAGLDRLQGYVNQLSRGVSGSEALNFLLTLDFDHYWDHSDAGRQLRQAVGQAVERWQAQRSAGRSAFGRIYLVDGHTADGIRDTRQRLDELSLFLEFLLFEGQRGGEWQWLYQAPGPHESPLGTFGIRLLEHSAGLLSRLAAARFGIGWLDYLAGDDGFPTTAPATELREQLAAYRPVALAEWLDAEPLRELLRRRLTDLAQELGRLPVDAPDWPPQLQSRYEDATRQLESDLAAEIHSRMQRLAQERLADLAAELEKGVEAALHHPRQPAPLGAVIRELETVLTELESHSAAAPIITPGNADFAALTRLHADYHGFKAQQLDPVGLHALWPLYALLLSLGLTPVAVEALADLPKPDPASSHFLWQWAYTAGQWLAEQPWLIGLGIGLLIWLPAAVFLQRSLRDRVQRARRFWNEPERGRLAGRLRAALDPGGDLGGPPARSLERLLQDLLLSLRTEVGRELGRMLTRLRDRRRELMWLREQLREFLRLHGLSATDADRGWARRQQETTGIRMALEREEDLQRMLQTNPPGPERFRSTQAERRPFAGWQQRYGDTFLYPLRFIDELSRHYRDPFMEELTRPGAGPEQAARARELQAFLAHSGRFAPACSWPGRTGVPVERLYGLLPQLWLGLPGVRERLLELGMTENHIAVGEDIARAYLLRVQIGVEPSCLQD